MKKLCSSCDNASIHHEACYPYLNKFTGKGHIEYRAKLNKDGKCEYFKQRVSIFRKILRAIFK